MSINTPKERQEELRKMWESFGPTTAKGNCENLSELLSAEEISADYYLGEAESVMRELMGNQDMSYLEEKIRHLVEMMDIATKHTPMNDRWAKAMEALRRKY